MRTILLIGINARYSHPAVALYYLRSFVRHIPVLVRIKEFTIRNQIEDILKTIDSYQPDAIGFSVYIWNSTIVKQLLSRLSRKKRFIVFLGGPEVSYNASQWLESHPAIDFIVTGPGEEGFRRLVENHFNLKENIIISKNPPFAELPFPYLEDDFKNFVNKNIYYESSRGCPFSCAYCISSCSDQKLQFRELSQISGEVDIIMNHSPKLVKFVDRTFNAKAERARIIWEMLIDRYGEKRTTFHFEIHPALLTEKDFSLLQRAPRGLFQFEIGIQTVHRDVRLEINRKGNWEKEKAAIERLHAMNNIHLHVDLIAGLPREDFNMLGDSFNKVYALGADHFQLGILKLLPGTAIRKCSDDYEMKYNPEAPYEIYQNKWLNEEKVRIIKRVARLVDALYNSKRFVTTMNELCEKFFSPWQLYCAMANENKEDFCDVSWLTMYRVLMDFISRFFSNEVDFFRDCLMYDWFSSFTTNRIPSIFKGKRYREYNAKVCDLIKRDEHSFGTSNQKTMVKVLVPETEKFKQKYLHGGEVVAYRDDGTKKIFFKEDLR